MNCPRCKKTLETKIIKERQHEVEVDTCPDCQGIWFDKDELSVLENVSEPVVMEWRKIPNAYDQLTALFCPSCAENGLMKKAEHPRDEKVIMDYCVNCGGIWLDGGELEAIQKESWLSAIFNLMKKLS